MLTSRSETFANIFALTFAQRECDELFYGNACYANYRLFETTEIW